MPLLPCLRKRKNITQEPDRGSAERSTLSPMMNSPHDAMDGVPSELAKVIGSTSIWACLNNKCPCFMG
jgi:hypothetical protein